MLTVIEKVLLLQDLDLFQYAYTEHLAQFAAICRESEVSRDTVLFREGEKVARLHLLVSGQVALESADGASRELSAGGLDFWSFFSENPSQWTARALEKCMVLTVPFEDVVDLMTAEPEFCWATLKAISVRGRAQSQSLADQS